MSLNILKDNIRPLTTYEYKILQYHLHQNINLLGLNIKQIDKLNDINTQLLTIDINDNKMIKNIIYNILLHLPNIPHYYYQLKLSFYQYILTIKDDDYQIELWLLNNYYKYISYNNSK